MGFIIPENEHRMNLPASGSGKMVFTDHTPRLKTMVDNWYFP